MLNFDDSEQQKLIDIKNGIIDIMKKLNDNKLVDIDTRHIFQFCIDQHLYKTEKQQDNGFTEHAVIDTLDTLTEALGYSVISDSYRTELEHNMSY